MAKYFIIDHSGTTYAVATTIPQSPGDCNNCKHNGTWAG